jgi:hypothetical protein
LLQPRIWLGNGLRKERLPELISNRDLLIMAIALFAIYIAQLAYIAYIKQKRK